ncbi:hypothetical protein [Pilimelia columellifera]|uniref:hypothetical protein n=1 Tax=Pilimelia columellifera TaxID=706574 RepID=UPI0031DC7C28
MTTPVERSSDVPTVHVRVQEALRLLAKHAYNTASGPAESSPVSEPEVPRAGRH